MANTFQTAPALMEQRPHPHGSLNQFVRIFPRLPVDLAALAANLLRKLSRQPVAGTSAGANDAQLLAGTKSASASPDRLPTVSQSWDST